MKHLLLILLLVGASQAGFAQTAPQKTDTATSAAKAAVTASAKRSGAPAPVVVTKKIWRTPAMDEAMAYYKALRYQAAYIKFREAIAQGDKDAYYFIGRMHQFRELKYDSVQIDTIQQVQNAEKYFAANKDSANHYYKLALQEGSVLGHLGLAEMMILRTKDDKRKFTQHMRTAAMEIREKAVAGDAFSNRILGSMYYTGFGEMVDKGLAFNYLSRAAEAGDVQSYTSLANLYLNGEGVGKDYEKAVNWLNKGVEAGEREALYTLALLYEEGTLGEVKVEEARHLYRSAVGKGSVNAYEQLMYINQTPDQKVVISAINRDPEMLQRAIAAGGDVNTLAVPEEYSAQLHGRTPLMHTVYVPMLLEDYGTTYEPEVRFKTVALLLRKGANVNAQDEDGKTALHYLVSSSRIKSELYEMEQVQLLDTLLNNGADPNIQDKEGNTVLAQALQATIGQHIGIMELEKLLQSGANPNSKNSEGKTPLMLACEINANYEVIVALLQAGADPKLLDNTQKAAIDYTKHQNVENILLASGSPQRQK
ncbi:ankyrin repeat domain-containing protein [Pontibacter saemangeumensis]